LWISPDTFVDKERNLTKDAKDNGYVLRNGQVVKKSEIQRLDADKKYYRTDSGQYEECGLFDFWRSCHKGDEWAKSDPTTVDVVGIDDGDKPAEEKSSESSASKNEIGKVVGVGTGRNYDDVEEAKKEDEKKRDKGNTSQMFSVVETENNNEIQKLYADKGYSYNKETGKYEPCNRVTTYFGWFGCKKGEEFSDDSNVNILRNRMSGGGNNDILTNNYGNGDVDVGSEEAFSGNHDLDGVKQRIVSDNDEMVNNPTNFAQQAARLRAAEKEKGWLAKTWDNTFRKWFGNEKENDARTDALDSFYTALEESGDETEKIGADNSGNTSIGQSDDVSGHDTEGELGGAWESQERSLLEVDNETMKFSKTPEFSWFKPSTWSWPSLSSGSDKEPNINIYNQGNNGFAIENIVDNDSKQGDLLTGRLDITDGRSLPEYPSTEYSSENKITPQSEQAREQGIDLGLGEFLNNSGILSGATRGSQEILGLLSNNRLTTEQGIKILGENIIQTTTQEAARNMFGEIGEDGEKHLSAWQSGLANAAAGVISAVSVGDTDRLMESVGGVVTNAIWDTLAENDVINQDVYQVTQGYVGNAIEHTVATAISGGDLEDTVKVFATDISTGYVTDVIQNNADLWGEANMSIGQTGVVTTGFTAGASSVISQLINNGSIDLEQTVIDIGKGVIQTEITNAVVSQYLASEAAQLTIANATIGAMTQMEIQVAQLGLDVANGIEAGMMVGNAGINAMNASTATSAANATMAAMPFISVLMSIGMDLVTTGTVHAETVGVGITAAAGATVGAEIYGPVGAIIGGAIGALAGAFGIGSHKPSPEEIASLRKVQVEAIAPDLVNNNFTASELQNINNALSRNDRERARSIINQSVNNSTLGQVARELGMGWITDSAMAMVNNKYTRILATRDDLPPGQLEGDTKDLLYDSPAEGSPAVNNYIRFSNKLADCYRRKDQDCVQEYTRELRKARGTLIAVVTRQFNKEIEKISLEIHQLEVELSQTVDKKKQAELRNRIASLSTRRQRIVTANQQFSNIISGGDSVVQAQRCANRSDDIYTYQWQGNRCQLIKVNNKLLQAKDKCVKRKDMFCEWWRNRCDCEGWDEGGDGA
jgi:hypothetical protein